MGLVKLAWRNLWRSRRRTLITALSVAGAVWMVVTFLGMGEWAYNDMVNKSATMGFGHISIAAKGYNDKPASDLRVTDAEKIAQEVAKTAGIDAVLVRVLGQGMFATAHKTTGGMLIGIDPSKETPQRNLFLDKLTQGELLKSGDDMGVIVGERMAKTMKLELGSKLVWTATDINGEIVSEVGRVRGMFKTGVAEIDVGTVLLPISKTRKVLGMKPGAATIVAVFIEDHRKAEAQRDVLAKLAGADNETLTWQQTQPEMASYVKTDRSGNEFFQFLIGLVVATGILNTMLMGVLERRRELGVLLAIGMRPAKLFQLVCMEAGCVGLLGLVIGVLLVIPWVWYMQTAGIDLSGMMTEQIDVGGVVFDMTMHIRLADVHYVAIPTGVFLLTMLAALYPALKAARLQPVESLRTLD